jgi:putative transposase
MSTQRKQYSAEFKARVALEALKGLKTVNELASTYGVHPTQIAHWKHRLQKEMAEIFRDAGTSGSATRRRYTRSCINKLDNSKWSWTG